MELSDIDYSDIDLLKFLLNVLYEHEYDELAWRLLDRFGSVPGIFSASYHSLLAVQGVTERVATFFSVTRAIERQALLRSAQKVRLLCEFDLLQYIAVYGMNDPEPFDMCIYLNNRNIIIGTTKLVAADGFRQAVCAACNYNAARVVVARYVPRNVFEPSEPSQVRLLSLIKLIDLLENIGMQVIDHFTYTPDKFYSVRRNLTEQCGTLHITRAGRESCKKPTSMLEPLIEYYNKLTDSNITLPFFGE